MALEVEALHHYAEAGMRLLEKHLGLEICVGIQEGGHLEDTVEDHVRYVPFEPVLRAEAEDVVSKCRRLARVERDVDLGRVDWVCVYELIILSIMAVVVLVPGVLRILGGECV